MPDETLLKTTYNVTLKRERTIKTPRPVFDPATSQYTYDENDLMELKREEMLFEARELNAVNLEKLLDACKGE